ncbi:hypothetical protein P154DRAFT_582995 [Amniculicola lignicola CBS 123094]|uniref:Uncharacterized protein n=1 Tax=Amniculicola lignicola CBS 123094 TaxID=1392246 RepID=A0A6A5W2D2_9PLEO|nr:hypothetical protein P154DRAFT_582995 [Amniculicola lignicola CBS 123094]
MAPAIDKFIDPENIPSNLEGSWLDWKVPGSKFRTPLPTATFAVAAICAFYFIADYLIGCFMCCFMRKKMKKTNKTLMESYPYSISKLILLLYFSFYVADRVLTEIGEKRVVMYYPFLIVLTVLTLFADATLMFYLLGAFTMELYKKAGDSKENSFGIKFGLRAITWGLTLLAGAGPAAFIYYLASNKLMNDDTKKAISETGGPRLALVTSYTKITLAFYCIYLGAALILTWIVISNVRKLKKRQVPSKAVTIGLPLLVTALDVRSLVQVVYAGYYTYKDNAEAGAAKLIRLIFYGFLCIVIYQTVIWVCRCEDFEEVADAPEHKNISYAPVVDERAPQPVYHADPDTVYQAQQTAYNPHGVAPNQYNNQTYGYQNA